MQLYKPQMLHQYVSEAGAHKFEKNQFPWCLLEVSDVVPERGKRQFLSWKHSVWETLSQKSVREHTCTLCGLAGAEGRSPSLLLLFLNAGTEPVKEQGMSAAHQQNDSRGRAGVGGQE